MSVHTVTVLYRDLDIEDLEAMEHISEAILRTRHCWDIQAAAVNGITTIVVTVDDRRIDNVEYAISTVNSAVHEHAPGAVFLAATLGLPRPPRAVAADSATAAADVPDDLACPDVDLDAFEAEAIERLGDEDALFVEVMPRTLLALIHRVREAEKAAPRAEPTPRTHRIRSQYLPNNPMLVCTCGWKVQKDPHSPGVSRNLADHHLVLSAQMASSDA